MGYSWRFLVFELRPSAANNDALTACFFDHLANVAKTNSVKWMLGDASIRVYGVVEYMRQSSMQAALAACHE
eukprot:15475155-Alexandrium_andersonii.AAC.1